MLFVSSNKLKLENMLQELDEIKKACAEILETPDIKFSLNSLEGLKSRLNDMQEEIKAILYQYREINEMMHQVDVMISDYYKMDIEISSYELNGMEQDLLGVKDKYKQFKLLKSEIGAVNEKINSGERI